jgi:hypothetical protein
MRCEWCSKPISKRSPSIGKKYKRYVSSRGTATKLYIGVCSSCRNDLEQIPVTVSEFVREQMWNPIRIGNLNLKGSETETTE